MFLDQLFLRSKKLRSWLKNHINRLVELESLGNWEDEQQSIPDNEWAFISPPVTVMSTACREGVGPCEQEPDSG
jgi:hypothetical protein